MSKIKNQVGAAFQTSKAVTLVVAVIIVGLISTTIIANGLLSASQRVIGSGMITSVNVGAYEDAQATTLLSSIDWGMITPGGSASQIVYIKNEGNTPLTLTLEAENWDPAESDAYISLSWDYSGVPLEANQVVMVLLSLQVSESIQDISSFTFDIVVIGTQVV